MTLGGCATTVASAASFTGGGEECCLEGAGTGSPLVPSVLAFPVFVLGSGAFGLLAGNFFL